MPRSGRGCRRAGGMQCSADRAGGAVQRVLRVGAAGSPQRRREARTIEKYRIGLDLDALESERSRVAYVIDQIG